MINFDYLDELLLSSAHTRLRLEKSGMKSSERKEKKRKKFADKIFE